MQNGRASGSINSQCPKLRVHPAPEVHDFAVGGMGFWSYICIRNVFRGLYPKLGHKFRVPPSPPPSLPPPLPPPSPPPPPPTTEENRSGYVSRVQ